MRRTSSIPLVIAGALALACSSDSGEPGSRPTGSRPGAIGAGPGTAGAGTSSTGGTGFGNPNPGGPMVTPTAGTGSALPPSDICEAVHVNANPATPDMLIVLDRSGSMLQEGRWMPSVAALKRVTMELQSAIRFGLAMFPAPPMALPGAGNPLDCLVAPDPQACLEELAGSIATCMPGGIVVPIALDNAAAISQSVDMSPPAGGTPTGETLQGLVDTFGAPSSNPDEETIARFVLLVTDGQPTCPAGGGSMTLQPDIDLANTAIDALTARGVRTYVIGYDTTSPGNEDLAAVLDGFAQRGGTGDTMHRPVEDEQSLLTELQRIAGDVVSCSFVLDEAPPRADFVLVRLDGQQINLNDPNGWMLVGDRNVQLTGGACDKLKDGAPHSVDVEVRCSVVIPE